VDNSYTKIAWKKRFVVLSVLRNTFQKKYNWLGTRLMLFMILIRNGEVCV